MDEAKRPAWAAPRSLGIKSQNLGSAHIGGNLTDKKIEKYILQGFYGETKRREYQELLDQQKKEKATQQKKVAFIKLTVEDLLS